MARDEDLLDTRGDVRRWNPILGGLLALGAGVAFLVAIPLGPVSAIGGAFVVLGLWLVSLGVRARQSYFRPEGLHRAGWTGEETIPWDRVVTIEMETMFADRDRFGRIRLHCGGRRRFTVNTATNDVRGAVNRIARRCPGAVIDDRDAGRVIPPREDGDSAEALRRVEAVRRRGRRAFSGAAALWIICAAVLLACGVGFVVLTVISGELGGLLIALVFLSSSGFALKLGLDIMAMRRLDQPRG